MKFARFDKPSCAREKGYPQASKRRLTWIQVRLVRLVRVVLRSRFLSWPGSQTAAEIPVARPLYARIDPAENACPRGTLCLTTRFWRRKISPRTLPALSRCAGSACASRAAAGRCGAPRYGALVPDFRGVSAPDRDRECAYRAAAPARRLVRFLALEKCAARARRTRAGFDRGCRALVISRSACGRTALWIQAGA